MSLSSAFNAIWSLQARDVQLYDMDTDTTYNVKAAPSNYFRNMSGPEEIVYEGREYVFSVKNLEENSAPIPTRSLRIVDAAYGEETITYTKEMTAMAEIIGYRVRTG